MGGFWKQIGETLDKTWINARENAKDQIAKGVMHASGYVSNTGEIRNKAYSYDAKGNLIGINTSYANEIGELYSGNVSTKSQGLATSYRPESAINYLQSSKWTNIGENKPDGTPREAGPEAENIYSKNGQSLPARSLSTTTDFFKLKLPDWTYADFINERAIWQKGLSSIFDEPAWFYFKVIFDFESTTGLFGGILNNIGSNNNSALTYLNACQPLYKQEKIKDRINALKKFCSILSYISTNAPWYFKGVKGLDKAAFPIIKEFNQENSIELDLNVEAIDMRLSTLMSLYQYACFDKFNGKEIIPENLRKFNMTIILFQTPLRYLHTSYTSNSKTVKSPLNFNFIDNAINSYENKHPGKTLDALRILNEDPVFYNLTGSSATKYKSMSSSPYNSSMTDISNMMSMKIFTFEGCEFDPMSFASVIPNSITNETPFQMGGNSLKITYTRCLDHTLNEFYHMLFGSDGFYFYSEYQKGNNSFAKNCINKQIERYKALGQLFEDVIGSGSNNFGLPTTRVYNKAVDASEAVIKGILNDSDMLSKIGTTELMKLLGRSWSADASLGNIYGNNVGLQSDYYKHKLQEIKDGQHEHTTKPHTYDPMNDSDLQEDLQLIKSSNHEYTTEPHQYSLEKDFDMDKWLAKWGPNRRHTYTSPPINV